jgi:hypothetical protein
VREHPGGATQEEVLLSERRIPSAGDPFTSKRVEQDHPHACWDGYIYLGYTDENDEEQIEKLPCRRCAEEGN